MPSLTPFDCAEAFARLDDYLDRELSPDEMERVREHLEVCAVCAAEFRFEARVLEVLKSRIASLRAPDELRARVVQSVARARAGDPQPPTGPAA